MATAISSPCADGLTWTHPCLRRLGRLVLSQLLGEVLLLCPGPFNLQLLLWGSSQAVHNMLMLSGHMCNTYCRSYLDKRVLHVAVAALRNGANHLS